MTVGPLSLVVPPALSILAAPLADTTVHVATGFGAQFPAAARRDIWDIGSATCGRENRHNYLTEGGAGGQGNRGGPRGPFLSLCRVRLDCMYEIVSKLVTSPTVSIQVLPVRIHIQTQPSDSPLDPL